MYAVDSRNKRIVKIDRNTANVTTVATISGHQDEDLSGLTIDNSNNIYTSCHHLLSQGQENKIYKITSNGSVSVYDAYNSASYMEWGSDGKLYYSEWNAIERFNGSISEYFAGNGNGGYVDGTGMNAQFHFPYGIAFDNQSNLYVADTYDNYRIRKVTPAGVVTTLAGNGLWGEVDGTGAAASFTMSQDLVVGNDDNIYVTSIRNIRKITPAGVVTTIVNETNAGYYDASGSGFEGIEMDSEGNFYVTGGGCIYKIIMGN
jgi:sugar lactone lactonase YvrE